MPKLLFARPPRAAAEERQVRRLARSRHAPGDGIRRARLIAHRWDGLRTTAVAVEVGCHPQPGRERLTRVTAAGLDGLGHRPGAGRNPRLTEDERRRLLALVKTEPPGRLVWDGHRLVAPTPAAPAHWALDALVAAAQARGITISRSPIRRMLTTAGGRGRPPRAWATSTDPAVAPKERRSAPAPPRRRPGRRSAAATTSGR